MILKLYLFFYCLAFAVALPGNVITINQRKISFSQQLVLNEELLSGCLSGKVSDISLLLDHGAEVNAFNSFASTPLMMASASGRKDIAEVLIRRGADIDAQNSRGDHALSLAAANGYLPVVKLLIELGAPVDLENIQGSTALMMSSANGHNDVVKALIDAGADVNWINEHHETALMYAANNDLAIETVKILLEAGAKRDLRDSFGRSADQQLGVSQEMARLITTYPIKEKARNKRLILKARKRIIETLDDSE